MTWNFMVIKKKDGIKILDASDFRRYQPQHNASLQIILPHVVRTISEPSEIGEAQGAWVVVTN
jgi:hypothetical protein